MAEVFDMTGQRYGRLVVVERCGSNRYGYALWLCKCDCGGEVIVNGKNLRDGNTNSCGCIRKEKNSQRSKIHGMNKTRLRAVWSGIKTRCYNPKSTSYKNYGGRGIKVCEEWLNSFEAFRDWAFANGYSKGLTIERIDVNGGYCPENCCWATMKDQSNNKRNNTFLKLGNEKYTIAQWSEKTGLSSSVIVDRLKRGWSIERALTTPTK